jgi:hypothetical protein
VTWTKLDDAFWSHPKVIAAGNEAAGAYVRMLSYCGKHLTDGHIPEDIAKFIAKPSALQRLAEHEFIQRNGSGWVIPDYLEFNPSAEKAKAKQKARSEAGKRGGRASRRGTSKR